MDKVYIIMRQTDYSEELTIQKLAEFNDDHIKVIKDFLKIPEKNDKNKRVVSVNQEIYKQLRYKLDNSIRDYNIEEQDKLTKEINTV
jgi:hypothetical protein